MKKVIFLTMMTAILLSGCAGYASDDKSSSAQTSAVTAGSTTENFTIPSRETFAELPDEQVDSLDLVMNAVDEAFPKEDDSIRRYYGYMGEESVENSMCFVFGVYDQTSSGESQIATVAVTQNNARVYILDEAAQEYVLLKTFTGKKTLDEYSWSFRNSTEAEDLI